MDEKNAPTVNDVRDMDRMVLPLDLRRRFSSFAVFGFSCVSGATWEYAIITSLGSTFEGGTGAVIWLFLATMIGMFCVILSLAEMASMAPSSAGQYHWVSEFAPARYQRLFSYAVGWFTAIGWQAAVAGNALIISQQTQALAAFRNPDWTIPGSVDGGFNWLTIVIMIAVTVLMTAINVYGMRLLPLIEVAMLVIHVTGFFAFLFPLWLLGDLEPAHEVFFTFQDNAGWGSLGLACLVGILGPTVTLIGGDNICHLAEETKDASKALPIAMTATACLNYTIAFIMTITILIVSGNYDPDLTTRTGQPWIAVVYAATRSSAATTAFCITIILTIGFSLLNTITTTSRQLYAFARDGGVPCSTWLAKVNPSTGLPLNSLLLSFVVTILLSFIAAASTIAFNNLISIGLCGLLLSYGSTISTMLFRRWRQAPLPNAFLRYSRPVGSIINIMALAFVGVAFIFIFFPAAPHPAPDAMNWSVVVCFGIILFAGVYYAIAGKRTYAGPVSRIIQRDRERGGKVVGIMEFERKQ